MTPDTHSSVKEMILASKRAAALHIANIKNAAAIRYDLVRQEVREYIKARFHLTEEDCVTDNFSQLAQISLAKSMKISRELVEEFDLARSCDGVSSHTAKMVLLFMALQKDLGIQFRPLETAEAETLDDIALLVWRELKAQSEKQQLNNNL
ncbi:MAG: hypothetical protein IKG70_06080 [Lachnospiraceae bacterium]|nr:hypothetical protein [Lachnospiraceae bacterium]